MTTSAQDGSHRRSATRAPVGRPIKLQFDDSMDVIEGLCRNISIGGMFISFEDSRPAGSLVRFELELEDQSAIRGLGEVVWMKSKNDFGGPESGFGLKFRFLEQRDRQMIFKLVSQHIKERLSKRESDAGETQPASPEALGIAVPPSFDQPAPEPPTSLAVEPAAPASEPPPAPASELTEELPPVALELPFEAPSSAPVETSPAAPEPAPPAAGGSASPPFSGSESELPALENLAASERELPDAGPPAAAGFDSLELDPSIGETPMYELGLESDSSPSRRGDFGPPAVSEASPAAVEPSGVAADADLPEHAMRQTAVVEAWPKRHASLLLVAGVVLATAAAAAYLYRDQLAARLGDEVTTVASRPEAAAGLEAPAGETLPGMTESGAAPPVAEPPSPAAETPDPLPASGSPGAGPADRSSVPPPPAVAPPPAAVAPPPAAVAPPPPAVPPARPVPSTAATSGFTRLVDVAWSEVPGGIKITLTADGPIPTGRYRYFRLSGGSPREVVKLTGVNQGYPKSQMTVGGPGVQRIRFGFHRGSEVHVVMDLTGPQFAISEVSNVGSRLELTLTE